MPVATRKIVLNGSRDIPFNKLVLSQSNVRRTKAGVSIEDLAEDIARRKLIQSLNVRPVLDAEGHETGMYEVPAGGRRFRALELLVKQKRLPKTALVPCVVATGADGISAEEDSTVENTFREALHPLDQFRAFQTLREQGLDEEEIAARFFVTPHVVRQRLKLAAVSPKLLDLYAEDGITLEQLMAFTVTGDHARQEQVWDALEHGHNRQAWIIRRMLTEGAVAVSDKRAQFVGVAAYEEAGGVVLRDLFQRDEGGWLQDVTLLDRLAREKLERETEAVRAEGWKWLEVSIDFPYGHSFGLRRLPQGPSLTAEEQAAFEALSQEHEQLEEENEGLEELPESVDQRLAEIEAMLEVLHAKPPAFDGDAIAYAGAFVGLDGAGNLRIERGFVRREDELSIVAQPGAGAMSGSDPDATGGAAVGGSGTRGSVGSPSPAQGEDDVEEGGCRISDRLMTELTAHRTLGLREALANDPDAAHLAVLHALAVKLFHGGYAVESCLEIDAKCVPLNTAAPGLGATLAAASFTKRHGDWSALLPERREDLWDALRALDADSRAALFAHCAACTVNAVQQPYDRRPRALAHGDRLAEQVALDMTAHFMPTADNYLQRVTKAGILAAVREAKGETSAQLIDHLKKGDMAKEAERLLAGTGWLPEPLRTPGGPDIKAEAASEGGGEGEALPAFLIGEDDAASGADLDPAPHAIAAE